MRPAVAMLAVLATGALSLALADPPADPVAPESRSTTAQNSAAEDSTDQNSAAHAVPATAAATVAETPAVAPAKPTPSASDERMQEQLLRYQGYKLSMVHGEKKYCRREIPLGSHLPTVLHCVTVTEAEEMTREARDTAERIQRNMPGCLSGSHGPVCGN